MVQFRIVKRNGNESIIESKNLTTLRRMLLREYIGVMDSAKVYSMNGAYKGTAMRGYSDTLWQTAAGHNYILNRNGTTGGKY